MPWGDWRQISGAGGRALAVIGLVASSAMPALDGQGQASQTAEAGAQFGTVEQYSYVQVDVNVVDRGGAFAADLQASDFEVLEDGVRQKISSIALVEIPLVAQVEAAPAAPLAALDGSVSASLPEEDGRNYLLVLDDLHVDARWTAKVKEIGRDFVDRLAANDRAMVISTGGNNGGRRLTRDRGQLVSAIDGFIGQKLPSATLEKGVLIARARELSIPIETSDPFESQRVRHARALLATLRDGAVWMGGLPNRKKSIVLFSEGVDYDVSDLVGTPGQMSSADLILSDTREMVSAANRANVSIYTIDPRGLARQADESVVGGVAAGSSAGRALSKELMMAQDSLRVVSQETGGRSLLNSNQPSKLFDQVVDDNSRYYLIAYDAPSHRADGKFHRIDVRVKRPGLSVRSRSGYASPTKQEASAAAAATSGASISPPLLDALRSPVPRSAVDLRLFTASFRGEGDRASVLIGLELHDKETARFVRNSAIEVGLMAVSAQGGVAADRRDLFTLNLQPTSLAQAGESGMRVLERLVLPAGVHELRVAVRDGTTGAIGSMVRELTVPDYRAAPLSMSEPVLTSLAGDRPFTLRQDQALRDVLPTPPSAMRAFAANDEVSVFVELYGMGAIQLVTTIEDEKGLVQYETRDEREGSVRPTPYHLRVPLDDLTPGRYLLAVTARQAAGEPSVQRRIEFVVTPEKL